jgi:hypothetical protein
LRLKVEEFGLDAVGRLGCVEFKLPVFELKVSDFQIFLCYIFFILVNQFEIATIDILYNFLEIMENMIDLLPKWFDIVLESTNEQFDTSSIFI